MPIMVLPVNLAGERQTELIEETVGEVLKELQDWWDNVYEDGILPGVKPHRGSANEKLGWYLSNTDPGDMEKLLDDNYLLRLKNGLDSPPVSPFWLNAVSSQGTFDRMRREFLHLVQQDQAKRIPGLNANPQPQPQQAPGLQ